MAGIQGGMKRVDAFFDRTPHRAGVGGCEARIILCPQHDVKVREVSGLL